MRRLAIVTAAVIMFAALISANGAKADTPTPTPVPGSPAILAEHLFRGVPLIADTTSLAIADANGVRCAVTRGARPGEGIRSRIVWPWNGDPSCANNTTPARVCVTVALCSDQLVSSGQDEVAELNWPEVAGQHAVTAHFVHNGVPQSATITGWLFEVGGRICSSGGIYYYSPATAVSDLGRFWPPPRSANCATSGEEIDVRFTTIEFGRLTTSFNWNGADTEYQVETGTSPPPATPTPARAFSSRITIHSLLRGVPLLGAPLPGSALSGAIVDGWDCGRMVLAVIGEAGPVIVAGWPWHDYAPCNEVGVPVKICVSLHQTCTEGFIFQGHDMDVDMNWPEIPYLHTVTAHFVRDGLPQPVTLTGWSLDAGGVSNGRPVSCGIGTTPSVTLSDVITWWGGGQYCSGNVHARFTTAEFGELSGTFNWTGGADVDYDVGIPSAETPSPAVTASPTPTVTPARLPSAGGPPASSDVALPLLAGGLAAIVFAAGAWKMSARRRRE